EPDPNEIMRKQMEAELDRMFPGMGRMWREIEKELERTMPEMVRAMEKLMREMSQPGQPLVGGVRITIGPDGVPKVEKFGNVRVEVGAKPEVTQYREPLTDIFEDKDGATITVELPGVEEKDIQVFVKGNTVHVHAEGDGPFKYDKEVQLSFTTGTENARAQFNNGILEIRVKRGDNKEGFIPITS
ncbi:MAG: Hsp20/alpha crystallin family protein, partial [Candidatus Diapherotrites archaeon]|nr:Hsp20/alpha crystallin family protein [Candidatus Diapherotrites archaeon]